MEQMEQFSAAGLRVSLKRLLRVCVQEWYQKARIRHLKAIKCQSHALGGCPASSLALLTLSRSGGGEKGLAHCSGIHPKARENHAKISSCGSHFYSRLMLFCESATHRQGLDLNKSDCQVEFH